MSGDKRLLNDGHRVLEPNRFMEETDRLIYAKPLFKVRCSDIKRCGTPLRFISTRKSSVKPTSTEQTETPVGFLLSWLASNLYRLMERNGHVFVSRLHKFLRSVWQMKARKYLPQPLFFSRHANQRDKKETKVILQLNLPPMSICLQLKTEAMMFKAISK